VSSVALNVIVSFPILGAWLAMRGTRYLSLRRERREQAEWERVRAGLSALDADLDRAWADAWAKERERVRRYR
jgi:hypothetical protein